MASYRRQKRGEHQVLSRLKKSKVLNGKFSPKIHLQTIGLILKVEKSQSPDSYQHWIESVLLVERLREVNALLGFTRIEAPEETQDPDKRPPRASLSKHDPTWVPVTDAR